jgi:alkylated DNA repair dioxygenase AlkB
MGRERYERPAFFTFSSSRFVHCAQRPTGGFLLPSDEEDGLARELADLPFKPFDFHGYLANRHVMSFGYRYDYDHCAVVGLRRFPCFSFPCEQGCRDIRPVSGSPPPSADQRVSTGAGIGRHRDKTQFDEVVGVSLLAPCALRFRRKDAETWDRVSLAVEPCSAYLLSGPSAPCGSTAFPRSMSFVIQSPCGRSLQRRLLVRRARNGSALLSLRSFRLHREKATGSVTELCSRVCRS